MAPVFSVCNCKVCQHRRNTPSCCWAAFLRQAIYHIFNSKCLQIGAVSKVPVAIFTLPARQAVQATFLLVDEVMRRTQVPAKPPPPAMPSGPIPSERTQRTMAGDIRACFLKVGRMAKLARDQREVFVNTL